MALAAIPVIAIGSQYVRHYLHLNRVADNRAAKIIQNLIGSRLACADGITAALAVRLVLSPQTISKPLAIRVVVITVSKGVTLDN